MSVKTLNNSPNLEINVKDVNTRIHTWNAGDVNLFGNIITAPNPLNYTIVNKIVTLYLKLSYDEVNNATTKSVTFANNFNTEFTPNNETCFGICTCNNFAGGVYLGTFQISDQGVLELNFPTIPLDTHYRVNCLISWQFLTE
jgi:hypothetical protein